LTQGGKIYSSVENLGVLMRIFLVSIVLVGAGWLVYDRVIREKPLVENNATSMDVAPKVASSSSGSTPESALQEGQFTKALQLIEAVPVPERSREWSLLQVRALDGLKRREEALKILTPLVDQASPEQKPDLLWLKASILLDSGEKDAAGEVLYEIFSQYSSSSHFSATCYRLKDLWKPWLQDRNRSVDDLIRYNKVVGRLVDTAVDDGVLQECYGMLDQMNSKIFQGSEPIAGILDFHKVNYGENLSLIAKQYGVAPSRIQRVNGLKNRNDIRANQTLRILKGTLRIVVDKRRFNMDVYLGELFYRRFPVGLGKGNKTPEVVTTLVRGMAMDPSYTEHLTGEVFPAGHEKNPIGSRWMPLQIGRGFGIHGTREPDSIGTESSNGCVRMRNEDVEILFDFAMVGDIVEIR